MERRLNRKGKDGTRKRNQMECRGKGNIKRKGTEIGLRKN